MKLTRIFDGRVGSYRTCFWLLPAVLACAASASGQSAQRVVVETTFPLNQPVELVGVEVAGGMHAFAKGGTEMDAAAAFDAPDDWLRGLTLRVKNLSPKPITYVQVSLSFPEAHYHNGGVGHSLRYGKNFSPGDRSAPDAKPLSPGEEAELIFPDEEFQSFRAFAERLNGSADFNRLRLGMASVKFADGTRAFVINPGRTLKPTPPAVKSN